MTHAEWEEHLYALRDVCLADCGDRFGNIRLCADDQDGRFEIGDIPPGTYKMVIWHPYLGGTKEQTNTIQPKSQAKVDIRIPAPTGRLYANEMVDKPYTRFGITDDAQSHIVPTLIRQER
jgi:hypothetical protein